MRERVGVPGLRKNSWTLEFCDPAMGSGAFLVQVCRWLGDRLTDAWAEAESNGKSVTADGDVVDDLGFAEPLPMDIDERIVVARRLIAERCIYGVDMNPIAVELAKLSIWLVTLAKGRPFGFLITICDRVTVSWASPTSNSFAI